MQAGQAPYRIGELAARSGVTHDTLRYYERRGLLPRPPRSDGGYRLYPEATIDRVRFIRQAQALGFTLDEIRQLVTFDGGGGQRQCQRVHDLLSEKLRELAAREAELRALRRTLQRSLRQCEAVLGTEAQAECPVVEEAAHGRHTGAAVSRRSPSRRPGRGRRSA